MRMRHPIKWLTRRIGRGVLLVPIWASCLLLPLLFAIPGSLVEPLRAIGWVGLILWIGLVVNRIMRRHVLDLFGRHWLDTDMPNLFKDIFSVFLFLTVFTVIVQNVFHRAVTGIWATSGVITIILGLALQSIILDLFVGVALHVDRPFRKGDWLETADGHRGKVEALTWRTVQLRTEANEVIFLPNAELGRAHFVNFSQDNEPVRFSDELMLEFDLDPQRAFRVLESALAAVAGRHGVLTSPEPSVVMIRADQAGVHYRVLYWIYPWISTTPNQARSHVMSSIVTHLQNAGLAVSLPVTVSPLNLPHVPVHHTHSDRISIIANNQLLRSLSEDVLEALDTEMTVQEVPEGTVISEYMHSDENVALVLEGTILAETIHPLTGAMCEAFRVEPGSWIGDSTMSSSLPSLIQLTAQSDCVLMEISAQRLHALSAAEEAVLQEIEDTRRERQLLIFDSVRYDSVLDEEEDMGAESQLTSIVKGLAGRARSLRSTNPRMMVVDDSALQRHQIRMVAEAAGWEVCAEAADGAEAIEKYRALRPDLVTMDLVMPKVNGLEALEEIRAFHAKARVLMVSAIDQSDKLEKAIELGAEDFVVKPVDPDQFERVLTNLRRELSTPSKSAL